MELPNIEEWNLNAVDFDDFSLDADQMVLAAVAMCQDLGLLRRFLIQPSLLFRWLLTVRRNYRDIPYHNWRHAFNVAQNMYAMLKNSLLRECFSDEEVLALFVSCLCHDLDHRGTNNAYQAKSGSALAASYGTEHTMEHHHFNHAILILSSEDHNILAEFSAEAYAQIVTLIKHCILATDLTVYFKNRNEFQEMTAELRDILQLPKDEAVKYLTEDERRELLQAQLMTACDLAACTKQWDIQRRVAYLVTTEFFDQGDKEMTELNLEPAAPMDRRRKHEFPFLQYKWIRDVCLPLYTAVGKLDSNLSQMAERAASNMAHWRREAEALHLLNEDEI
ncbi:unnamed protein product [Notodromas monacha]|uniref:PDEase domain-containing protein n=1 Tax=Notodromas monacha TaxID=399045 RepID=A0A7R9BQK8_9CRUS|nr:unnamed protein product [Notodromas monacha]CAG0919860.1 unnamed protein product [Notodromas monacha]